MRTAVIALLLTSLVGCADPTAIVVEVTSASLSVPADVDAIGFEASSPSTGRAAARTFRLDGPFPHSLAIRPGPGPDDEPVTIRVIALRGGEEVLRRVIRSRFAVGRRVRVQVELTRECLGVSCPRDVDCLAGRCEAPPPDAGVPDGGAPDAGPPVEDGGIDAGRGDAGPRDAGPSVDGGRPDAGPGVDACVPIPRERCNGADDDCDGRVDEGVPCPGSVVLSELATGGPGGAIDEFVEIYNRTPVAIDLSAVRIEYRAASGASWSTRARFGSGAEVPAHGFFLAASDGYRRGVTPDHGPDWVGGFAATGGHVRLVTDDDVELDRIGYGIGDMPEGVAVPVLADDRTQSYERKATLTSTAASMAAGGADEARGNGQDTDDNSQDIVHRLAPEPQSSAHAAEPPP